MKKSNSAVFLIAFMAISSCSKDDKTITPVIEAVEAKVTVNPAITYQTMVGFGGALAWYCDRVITSSKKDQISNLLFSDLGADIIRFKNWYYPDGYPGTKTTTTMSDDNSKSGYDATNLLYTLAKQANPNVKVLLSSWGPPASLKSNASSRQGTLKKDPNGFMYDAFADYWNDILDNTPFNPDYVSIQNEPTYVNTGWTTCEWAATESATLPGYDIAFDKVYQKIQARPNLPVMIGPESANIGTGASGNSFSSFADALKNKSYLGAYAWHPYNFNGSTPIDQTTSLLQMVRSYSNRPNFMTEYSDSFSWLATAQFIHAAVTEANSSSYIYWKLAWATPTSGTDAAMVSIASNGDFIVTPYFYVIKHYAKHVDAGYKRIDVSVNNAGLLVSAYSNPTGTQITLVMINKENFPFSISFDVINKLIKSLAADQTAGTDMYKKVNGLSVGMPVPIKQSSVTTVVLDI